MVLFRMAVVPIVSPDRSDCQTMYIVAAVWMSICLDVNCTEERTNRDSREESKHTGLFMCFVLVPFIFRNTFESSCKLPRTHYKSQPTEQREQPSESWLTLMWMMSEQSSQVQINQPSTNVCVYVKDFEACLWEHRYGTLLSHYESLSGCIFSFSLWLCDF